MNNSFVSMGELLVNNYKSNPEKVFIVDQDGKRETTGKELLNFIFSFITLAKEKKLTGIVPIITARSWEYIASIVALNYMGLGVCILQDGYPKARIDYIVNELSAKETVDEEFINQVKNTAYKDHKPSAKGDEIGFVFYTSGSTGKPKGVVYTNEDFATLVSGKNCYEDGCTVKKVASTVALSFIASTINVYNPMIRNQELHILSDETKKDIYLLKKYIEKYDVDGVYVAPRLLKFMPEQIGCLKYVITAGEKLMNVAPREYQVYNVYGLTETGPMMAFRLDKEYQNTPIGKPFSNDKVYIVDENGNLANEGEIVISGVISKCYYNLKDETEKAYKPNPFDKSSAYKTLFYTNDIGKYDENGNVVYLDRKDNMVKINGQRVEIGEVEAILSNYPNIKEWAVKAFIDNDQNYLVAYFTSNIRLDISAIKSYLAEYLVSYMIPTFIVQVDKFDYTSSGKLNKLSLVSPDSKIFKNEYVAPTTAIEKRICTAFEKTLNVSGVGIQDDFFKLGGDSILVVALQSYLKDLGLSTFDIFNGKTPKQIALNAKIEAPTDNESVTETDKYYPLNSSQLGVYLACVSQKDSLMYNNPICLALGKNTNQERLRNAILKVIDDFSAFKVSVVEIDGEIVMQPISPYIDVKTLNVERKNLAEFKKDFVKPFDFEKGNLSRFAIVNVENEIYLFIDVHHIIYDGSSVSVLLTAINDAYNGKAFKREEVSIFEIAKMENVISQEKVKEAKEFFDAKLCGNDFESALLVDYDENDSAPYGTAGVVELALDEAVSTLALEKFVKENGVSEASFFLASFAYALTKMVGDDGVNFTTVNSGRHNLSVKNSIAMMVKTMPLSIALDENTDSLSFILDVANNFYQSMQYDYYPFSKLVEEYSVNNDTMFVYQSTSLNGMVFDGKSVELEFIETGYALSKIACHVYKKESGYLVAVNYRNDLYEKETIVNFLNLFKVTVKAFLTNAVLKDIALLDNLSTAKLNKFNQPTVIDNSETVLDMFARQVKSNPTHSCVVSKNASLTYKQVDDLTNKLAGYLISNNLAKGDVVAILCDRDENMLIGPLAVLKAGCIYQPLDSTYPKERLTYMLNDSQAKLLISTKTLSNLVDTNIKTFYFEDVEYLPVTENKPLTLTADDGYALLYTSGSTGNPKGCVIKHGGISTFVKSTINQYYIDGTSSIAAYASFGFDANVMDTSTGISSGATLHIIPFEMRLELDKLNDYLNANNVTHLFMTTQVGRQFVLSQENSSLKYLVIGGETLVPLLPPTNYTLLNAYGPTETTVIVTNFVIDRLYKNVPIGKTSSDVKLYVVDKYLRRVPLGVKGELLIAGPQVVDGYLNNPTKTKEAFIDNPFDNDERYRKTYRSGDVVRFLNDGNIQFVGRKDSQVKIRGFRVELTEVEEIIRRFDGIKDATVVAFNENNGGKYIVAYVVSDQKVNVDRLNEFISSEKPSYMVPAVTMQIDSIPLNQNQKVNKKLLPVPEKQAENLVLPRNDTEKKIFEIISNALGHSSFGVTNNLFEYGVTSISSIRICSLLSKAFDHNLSNAQFKENNTVEKLAVFLNGKEEKQEYELLDLYPISKNQEGIFYECLSSPETTSYNIPSLIKLGKSVDVERLKESVVKVVKAHPYLLASFVLNEYGLFATRNKNEFSAENIKEIRCENLADIKGSLVTCFNIQNSLLLRASVIRAKEDNYLFLDIHHLIFDGSSFGILISDINKAYNGENVEKETFTQYELAIEEKRLRNSKTYAKAKKYYADTFADNEGVTLPVPDELTENQGNGSQLIVFEQTDVSAVKDFCVKNKFTENVFFTATFGYLLARYTQEDNPLFTTIYNGRNDPRLENCISMFVKTYPVSCNVNTNDVKRYIKTVGEQMLNSTGNDIYSFMEINNELQISADVMFVYQGEGFLPDKFCGESFSQEYVSLNAIKAIMDFEVSIVDGKVSVKVEYDKSKYTDAFMKEMCYTYQRIINQTIVKENLDDIVLADEKTIELLETFHGNLKDYKERSIVESFCDICKKYPNKVAVVSDGKTITYKELDEITSALAQYLVSNGIKKNDVVAVLSNRDFNMVVCPLGILKARATYQPLDSSYPKERLTYMVKDSRAKMLITPKELTNLVDTEVDILYAEDINKLPNAEIELPYPDVNDGFAVLYTSGSTGLPKGCLLSHLNLNAFIQCYSRYLGLTEKDNMAIYASFGFDANMADTFTSLVIGATCHIINQDIRLDLYKLNEYFESNDITFSFITTQVGREFYKSINNKSLRNLVVGGETLVPIEPIRDYAFHNGYGPTETTAGVTFFKVDKLYKNVPIGRALGDVKLYIVDKNLNRVPIGVAGELLIAGPQVSKGYLYNEEKTSQVYIENPFTDDIKYKRMYRSGDVVRFLSDGNIQFIGRKDHQVKIRGFRIELSEIEEIIRRFDGIKDATVVAFDEANGGKYLAAYVVSDTKVDVGKLNEFIGSEKPSYMVPAVTMQIDKIPLNQNQKVNRKALPIPNREESEEYVEPANEIEKDFADMMKEVLSLKKFSVTSNFFNMGGSSIFASKLLIMALAKNYVVSYADLFTYPTPRVMAEHLLKEQSGTTDENDSDSVENYDYDKINRYLDSFNIKRIDEAIETDPSITSDKMGNILLTGATGFLGVHVLREYVSSYKGTAYCLIRGSNARACERRLKARLSYYFFDDFEEYFESGRIVCVNGTINDEDLFDKLKDIDFTTIINCAALVKHFVADDSLFRSNTLGVRTLIDVAHRLNKRLVQTSTYSVSGWENNNLTSTVYTENSLYIKQTIDNEYIRTKFLAERDCIEASMNGDNVKVLRLGNLMPRFSDGEFQINFETNGFMRDLRGVMALGCVPMQTLDKDVDLSTIDYTASSVLKIADSDLPLPVYHLYNNYKVRLVDILEGINECGFDIKIVNERVYKQKIKDAINSVNKTDKATDTLGGLIAYKQAKTEIEPVYIKVINELTVKALYRLNFRWPIVDKEYVSMAIKNLMALRFFEKDNKI